MNDARKQPDGAPRRTPEPATPDAARTEAPKPNSPDASKPEPPTPDAPTADQLRGEIDSGATHDKVANADPAAAPLGTDDEAAGTPPTAGQVATARRHETGRQVADSSPADQPPTQSGMAPSRGFVLAIVSAVIIFAVIGIAFSW